MANRAQKYHQNAKNHMDKLIREYKNFIKSLNLRNNEGWSVMDIGCGSGRALEEVLLPLLPSNVSEIVGVDMDENMIDFCRSNNRNPKILYEQLDIAGDVPDYLQNRFDVLFSSYCLSHIRNLRKGFENCSKLLKTNGELYFIIQYKTHALYSTYKEMSGYNKWAKYMEEYKNFTPHFSSGQPEYELKNTLKGTGLTLLDYKFEPDSHIDHTKREIFGVYESIDTKAAIIPTELQNEYKQDFRRIMEKVTKVDFTNEEALDDLYEFNVPIFCVRARKTGNV